jgi:polysaccharide export outer membrane protein
MAASENPIVTVRMSSYSISVLGEVTRAGSYQITREKVTILEALAMAGDMTIYGVRDKVKLIREDSNGQKSIHILNLNDANIINSPYYYLQQNDVVYVEPNKVKSQNSSVGSMTTLWFSATSILISLTSLLYNILK